MMIVQAQAKAALGDLDGALAALRPAWALERQLPVGDSERGNSLRLEAALLVAYERYEDALDVHERIESELRAAMSPRDRIALDQSIGWLLCRVGQCARARPRFEAVLRGDEPVTAALAQLGLAELELEAGAADRARVLVTQGLRSLEREPESELVRSGVAEGWYLLLRCAEANPGDAAELARLAASTRAAFEGLAMPSYIAEHLARLDAEEKG